MKIRARVVILSLGLALSAGALGASGCSARAGATGTAPGGSAAGGPAGSGSAGGDRQVPVQTAVVKKQDVPIILEGLGTVTPLATVVVKTQVDGRLDKVLFTEGQTVKKGDVIALVDPRPFAIQLHTAEAALFRDDAQLRNGKLNLERYETLKKTNLIPQQQVDDQRTAVDQLEAAKRADQAQIEAARLNLDYARITSPIDGVTGLRQVDQGNVVHQTDPNGLVVITQVDPIGVLFTLPQDDLSRIQSAMLLGKLPVEAYARDGIQKLTTGELLLIDNQVNSQTATIRLKAVLPNADHALWPNGFVKARMRLSTAQGALVVPASTIQRGPNGTFGYVVGPDKTVQPRPIDVSSIEGDVAIIGKGLKEGEVVVTDGQNQLRPGSKVAPRPMGAAAASASASGGPVPSASAAPPGSATMPPPRGMQQ